MATDYTRRSQAAVDLLTAARAVGDRTEAAAWTLVASGGPPTSPWEMERVHRLLLASAEDGAPAALQDASAEQHAILRAAADEARGGLRGGSLTADERTSIEALLRGKRPRASGPAQVAADQPRPRWPS